MTSEKVRQASDVVSDLLCEAAHGSPEDYESATLRIVQEDRAAAEARGYARAVREVAAWVHEQRHRRPHSDEMADAINIRFGGKTNA